ncbi:MAG: hypothetical protein ACLFV7_07930 [Phycisphaerae bacterium]
MHKTFVGFGFGPIQSGLFLYEAYLSGNFERFVVAEVDADLVKAVRDAGGRYAVNIARRESIDPFELSGIELLNPRDGQDRAALLSAIVDADELATALPSVDIFDAGGDQSVAALLAEGFAARSEPRPTVIYAAENNNHAAEILSDCIDRHHGGKVPSLQVLNTVVGKMSGVISDPPTIRRLELVPITPRAGKAILIEEFNRILISQIELPGYTRGIEVFQEKPDLLPFEEAKLYGHNAIHAMIGYLADLKGYRTIAEAGGDEWIMSTAREAFLGESGAALIARHRGLGDPLFTPEGYRAYADDLLERMVNPNLNDLVARVGRDHARKLGYDDRLYGTMRLSLEAGAEPSRLAMGAAAGVISMIRRREELPKPPENLPACPGCLNRDSLGKLLTELWDRPDEGTPARLIDLTWQARGNLPDFAT